MQPGDCVTEGYLINNCMSNMNQKLEQMRKFAIDKKNENVKRYHIDL